VRLGYKGPSCRSEGLARGLGVTNHQGSEVRIEGLALMDQGNGEGQERLQSMNQ
jgi:hypothetical protein